MNTLRAKIKLSDFHTTAERGGITPAEVIVLREIHDKEAGGCCIVEPRAESSVDITPATEVARLKKRYKAYEGEGKARKHIVDVLFGAVNPQLPQTFSDMPPKYQKGICPLEPPKAAEPIQFPSEPANTLALPVEAAAPIEATNSKPKRQPKAE